MALNFQQGRELVDAREREAEKTRHVFRVKPRAAQRNAFEQAAAVREPSLQRPLRVELDSVQGPSSQWNFARCGAKRPVEGIAK